ncbi:hypothetical protein [Hymenobacter cavernae]|uniref:DUF1735 domain-containing protein n=1 Tax=Hymenobacter cavernae TaxID=2044852 RepID=A0ABQ1U6S3_9BACT|nr:hypothetical protein [Hymenobacter cavernae]GGF11994.1 hypothetical protein GCM10011383_24040 [Hymenobacter cavernae]
MLKPYSHWRFALAISLLLTACQKDSDLLTVGAKPAEVNTLAAFVAVHGAPRQLFTLAAATDSFQLRTAQGNRLVIPANAFVLPSGARPNPEPISIEYREVLSRADMVLSALPSTASEQLLEAGGEFYLKARQGSNTLRLNPTAHVRLHFRNSRLSTFSNMAVFYGTTSKNVFSWLPQSSADISSSVVQDSLPSQPRSYRLRLNNDSLGWVSCARLVDARQQTTVSIAVSGDDVQSKNTMVFLVFKSLNTSVRAYSQSSDNIFSAPNIPEGLAVTAVVLRNVNGSYFFGQQTLQVGTNQMFSPSISAVSEEAAVAAIRGL